ncbi:MAG: segregation/condensation protein A, partial [Sphaerochaetaceae bacterium]
KAQFMLPFSDEELWHDVDVVDLLRTYADLMGKIDSLSHKVFNIYEEVTINEKVTLMNELLESNDVIHFTDVIVKINSPEHVISAFLAVLESVKDCLILIRQDADYGDIAIWRRPDGYEAMPPDGVEADADRE